MIIPPENLPAFLSGIESEYWQGHTTDLGYDWRAVALQFCSSDPGRFEALSISMLASGGNLSPAIFVREPASLADDPYTFMWDGNHRAAAALYLSLPLLIIEVSWSAINEATCQGYPSGREAHLPWMEDAIRYPS